jgi:hypothetical protein
LCALIGWVAFRSTLALPPNTRLPSDILGAALGLGTIGLITTAPLAIVIGIVLGVTVDKTLTVRAKRVRCSGRCWQRRTRWPRPVIRAFGGSLCSYP